MNSLYNWLVYNGNLPSTIFLGMSNVRQDKHNSSNTAEWVTARLAIAGLWETFSIVESLRMGALRDFFEASSPPRKPPRLHPLSFSRLAAPRTRITSVSHIPRRNDPFHPHFYTIPKNLQEASRLKAFHDLESPPSPPPSIGACLR